MPFDVRNVEKLEQLIRNIFFLYITDFEFLFNKVICLLSRKGVLDWEKLLDTLHRSWKCWRSELDLILGIYVDFDALRSTLVRVYWWIRIWWSECEYVMSEFSIRRVEIEETVVNGTFNMLFLGYSISLGYRNHTNIVMRLVIRIRLLNQLHFRLFSYIWIHLWILWLA